jgi:hypothetical protein
LYNPLTIPSTAIVPIVGLESNEAECEVGARVMRATFLRSVMKGRPEGYQPSYSDLMVGAFSAEPHVAGWRLEHFIVDLLLDCKEGYVASDRRQRSSGSVFSAEPSYRCCDRN